MKKEKYARISKGYLSSHSLAYIFSLATSFTESTVSRPAQVTSYQSLIDDSYNNMFNKNDLVEMVTPVLTVELHALYL
jgi:hypothetical protein